MQAKVSSIGQDSAYMIYAEMVHNGVSSPEKAILHTCLQFFHEQTKTPRSGCSGSSIQAILTQE